MPQKVRDVMTPKPVTVSADVPLFEVARAMRDADIGAVIVVRGEETLGIITDRDIVVRAIADGGDAVSRPVEDVCSSDLVTVDPDTDVDDAAELMRRSAVRRVPVLDGEQPVGIVSLGDLAVEQAPTSALGQISAAPANT